MIDKLIMAEEPANTIEEELVDYEENDDEEGNDAKTEETSEVKK